MQATVCAVSAQRCDASSQTTRSFTGVELMSRTAIATGPVKLRPSPTTPTRSSVAGKRKLNTTSWSRLRSASPGLAPGGSAGMHVVWTPLAEHASTAFSSGLQLVASTTALRSPVGDLNSKVTAYASTLVAMKPVDAPSHTLGCSRTCTYVMPGAANGRSTLPSAPRKRCTVPGIVSQDAKAPRPPGSVSASSAAIHTH